VFHDAASPRLFFNRVAVSADGTATVVGSVEGTLSLGDDRHTVDRQQALVATFGSDHAHRWHRTFGAAAGVAEGIAVARRDGVVAVVGSFTGEADFGAGPRTSRSLEGSAFLAVLLD